MHEFSAISYPVRVHSGRDALASLANEVDRCKAGRVFVVCGRSVATRTGLIDRIRHLLAERMAGVYTGITKDAPVNCVLEAVEAARACNADLLVAVGAGSVIKAVRVIAILLAEQQPLADLVTRYPDGGRPVSPRLTAPKLPIINILTAATSAQNRAGAALKDEDDGYRKEFFDPKTRSRAIFWDAESLLSAPPSLAVSTGVSIYWRALMNIGTVTLANPLAQASRYHAFRLAHEAMSRAADPDDYQARIDLCAAALLQNRDEDDGGRPFDSHWISRVVYALAAATFNLVPAVGQGQANAVLTGAAIKVFGHKCPDVVKGIGRAVGILEDMNDADAPAMVGPAVDEVFRSFGMPTQLRVLGVCPEHLSEIVRISLKNFNADRERSFAAHTDLLFETLRTAW